MSPERLQELVLQAGPEQLIFGLDFPYNLEANTKIGIDRINALDLPEEEPDRSQIARHLARKLAEVAIRFQERRSGLLISTINDEPAASHFIGRSSSARYLKSVACS